MNAEQLEQYRQAVFAEDRKMRDQIHALALLPDMPKEELDKRIEAIQDEARQAYRAIANQFKV